MSLLPPFDSPPLAGAEAQCPATAVSTPPHRQRSHSCRKPTRIELKPDDREEYFAHKRQGRPQRRPEGQAQRQGPPPASVPR